MQEQQQYPQNEVFRPNKKRDLEWYKERIKKAKSFLAYIAEQTTIHGFMYLAKKGAHNVERYVYGCDAELLLFMAHFN